VGATPHYDGNEVLSVRVRHFLEQCSNITVYDATTTSFARGVCMGYTRGLVEGHQIATRMNQKPTKSPVWCLPPKINSATLMQVVDDWINTHPSQYSRIMDIFTDTNAATAVILAAVLEKYPC
jgi:hypothetical protein